MTKHHTKTDALLDDLLKDCDSPKDILGENGLLKGLTKRIVQRAPLAERTNHLGYVPHARSRPKGEDTRNGTSAKTVQTDQAAVELEVPRDRAGTFEPSVVKKRERRLEGFDDKSWCCMPMDSRLGKSKGISKRCMGPRSPRRSSPPLRMRS